MDNNSSEPPALVRKRKDKEERIDALTGILQVAKANLERLRKQDNKTRIDNLENMVIDLSVNLVSYSSASIRNLAVLQRRQKIIRDQRAMIEALRLRELENPRDGKRRRTE